MRLKKLGNVADEMGGIREADSLYGARQSLTDSLCSFKSRRFSGQHPMSQGTDTPGVGSGSGMARPSQDFGCSPQIRSCPLGEIAVFMRSRDSEVDQHS
jgi:hypothetical protein